MSRCSIVTLLLTIPFLGFAALMADETSQTAETEDTKELPWMTDYTLATEKAVSEGKILLIFFKSQEKKELCSKFESESLEHPEVKDLLKDYVLLRLPVEESDSENKIQQVGFVQKTEKIDKKDKRSDKIRKPDIPSFKETPLLKTPDFSEMLNLPGVAMIDYKYKDTEHFGKVVSVFPFRKDQVYDVFETKTLLTLPPGTVTQRSLIYAVRIHPDNPKSTTGELNGYLREQAESASLYQAKIRLQGHHNWERRFHMINTHLSSELWAAEVCAESWPHQRLLESAIECVRCWRFSEGHWSAVVAEHPYYAYDMKRGSNGVWYATGLFGKWKSEEIKNRSQTADSH
ncbi:MAG: thioredoxin family protein [Planctomycetaceae bacterium]|nr:thioredoxin family protein [Planctomycetaceae bacterium]